MPSKDDEHDVCDGHIQLHGPKELPAEGLRVYCGDGDSRLYALWTTLAEVLAGQLPGKGFLLTDADYKPLEPHQQVTGPELVKLAGYGRDHRWQQMCHLGMSYGCWEAGTKVRTMCDRLKRASLAARQESMAATDSGNEEEDEEEEEQAEEQQEVKLQLPDLPPEGLRVYFGDGDSRQHALWTTVVQHLAGEPPGAGFLLTDADYKPLEPPQRVIAAVLMKRAGYSVRQYWNRFCMLGSSYGRSAAGTSIRTMRARLKRESLAALQESIGASDSGSEDEEEQEEEEQEEQEEQEEEEQEEVTLQVPDLPAEGLRVYCGDGDSRQHALWTTVAQYLAGEPAGADFLLTDADYKLLEPHQHLSAGQLVRAAGFLKGDHWISRVKLGLSFADHPVGTSVGKATNRLRCNSRAVSRPAKLPELPPEGLRVYCGDGDSRQHALWTSVAQYLAGEPPGDGFLLTDADYKPLEPPQRVIAAVLMKRAGYSVRQYWNRFCMLGSSYGRSAAGTSIRTMRDRLKHASRTALQDACDLEGLPDLPAEGLRVYCGDGDSRQHALWTALAEALAGQQQVGADFLLTDAEYKPLVPHQHLSASRLVRAAGFPYGDHWKMRVKLGLRFADHPVGTSVCKVMTCLGYNPRALSRPAKRPRAVDDDVLEAQDASSDSQEDDKQEEEEEEQEQVAVHNETAAEEHGAQAQARQHVKRQKLLAAHTTKPSISSQGPRDGVDLSLLPPLPPLKYKTSKELFLQSEIELMSGLAGLLHVLGHGDAWRQLWHRYLHHYITSSLTMRHLDKHYEALQAAVQSESVPAIKAVLREQFKLQV